MMRQGQQMRFPTPYSAISWSAECLPDPSRNVDHTAQPGNQVTRWCESHCQTHAPRALVPSSGSYHPIQVLRYAATSETSARSMSLRRCCLLSATPRVRSYRQSTPCVLASITYSVRPQQASGWRCCPWRRCGGGIHSPPTSATLRLHKCGRRVGHDRVVVPAQRLSTAALTDDRLSIRHEQPDTHSPIARHTVAGSEGTSARRACAAHRAAVRT